MKKVFSLLLVVAMLVSMTVVAFAAEPNAAGGMHTIITETDTDITVTINITNAVKCSGFTSYLVTDKLTYVDGSLEVNPAFDTKMTVPSGTTLKVVYGMSSADTQITNSGTFTAATYKVTKADGVELTEADFAYGTKINNLSKVTTATGSTIAGISAGTSNFATNKSTAKAYFTLEYVDDRTPIVENPFSATVAGTTITCAGKVDATVENYGVVFTAESTVEGARAQKYYGAMPGDTVKDYYGSTTFTFGEWDGTFEIILEGVHTGEKELDFFVNDSVIDETNFVLNVK